MAITVNVQSDRLPRQTTRAGGYDPVSARAGGAFGGEARGQRRLGKHLEVASDHIAAIALDMKREDDETAAKEADVRIAERIRRTTMGDPGDPEAPIGYLSTQGNVALDTFGEAEETIRAALQEEVEAAGDSADRRNMILNRGLRRVNVALDRMTGHASQQRLAVQERTSLAREAQALADVSADWQSDIVLGDALKDVAAEVQDRAEAQGMGEESTAAMLAQHQSTIVKGAFDAALVGLDVPRAQAIFSANADKLTGPVRTTMAQALATDTLSSTAQKVAGESVALYPGDPAKGRKHIRDALDGKQESAAISQYNSLLAESRGDARFAVSMRNAIQSQGAYQRQLDSAARAEANHMYTMEQRRQKEALRHARSEAYNFLYEDAGEGRPNTVAQFRQQNPELYDVLARNGEIETFVKTERNIQEGQIYAVASNGATLSALKLTPYEELAKVDPVAHQSKLTSSEYSQLVNSVASAKKRVDADARDRPVYASAEAALKDFYPSRAFRRGAPVPGSEYHKQLQIAETNMGEWVTYKLEAGEYPTPPEIKAEAARQMMAVEVNTGWGDKISDWDGIAAQRNVLTLEQRALATVDIDLIPKPISDAIIDAASDVGVEESQLTDDHLEALAGALAMGDQTRFERVLSDIRGE